MATAIIPLGFIKRGGDNKQHSNGWYLLDLNDSSRSCTYHLLHSRRHDNVCSNYFPGIAILDRPVWLTDVVSNEEWKADVKKFNEALMSWWQPGDLCRSVGVFIGSFTLVPLIFYFACDEQGQCCFVNRKKRQAMNALKSVCESLTSSSRFEWIVEWIPEEVERANASSFDVKYIQVRIKCKSPIGPFEFK